MGFPKFSRHDLFSAPLTPAHATLDGHQSGLHFTPARVAFAEPRVVIPRKRGDWSYAGRLHEIHGFYWILSMTRTVLARRGGATLEGVEPGRDLISAYSAFARPGDSRARKCSIRHQVSCAHKFQSFIWIYTLTGAVPTPALPFSDAVHIRRDFSPALIAPTFPRFGIPRTQHKWRKSNLQHYVTPSTVYDFG
jgi:hypothetical protein